MPEVAFWQGNEAIAYGALAAGCRFFGGYPITPSSEIAEIMAERLPKLNGRFIQMEDEIAGIAATIGGSIAGMKSLTATSGPGFSLKQENLGLAYIAEIPICVVVDVMRGRAFHRTSNKSSTAGCNAGSLGNPRRSRNDLRYAPASVQECYEVTIKAFNAAERYRQPVLIMSDEVIGHMREKVFVPEIDPSTLTERKRPVDIPEKFVPYRPDPRTTSLAWHPSVTGTHGILQDSLIMTGVFRPAIPTR